MSVSIGLIKKLVLTFLSIIILVGISYISITIFIYTRFFEETTQKLNSDVAQHLIKEKFQGASPFLPSGEVNKPLFGDIMHDMMAVNQGIEVYLLDDTGLVLYSVVLDHDSPETKMTRIDMLPVFEFIEGEGSGFVLGDDPRVPEQRKIFSAASFDIDGRNGYIYIILAGQKFDTTMASLWSSYFLRLGTTASFITLIFTGMLGVLAIWYLTRSLREIIFVANRFREGDMQARIQDPDKKDLSELTTTFNNMADTIVGNLEKLQSVEVLRRELIANVSHDLRTPLSIMQGYVETLRMKNDRLSEEEKDKYLGVIEDSSIRLSKLVAQLFEYSKLEANQIKPQKEPFHITELVSDLHAHFQVIAEKEQIKLDLEIPEGVPMVFADISLVERAIQNLMDNALKFTGEKGSVTLALEAGSSSVKISIKDSGPGITQEDQALIFERYRQSKTGEQKSGAGLGLAIVKKILEIHDSTINVISKPNQGTTFHFSLQVHML